MGSTSTLRSNATTAIKVKAQVDVYRLMPPRQAPNRLLASISGGQGFRDGALGSAAAKRPVATYAHLAAGRSL
jgi:hypothetical protein